MANAYTTLVNPLTDVGETRVHGITEEDIASAPTFHEIVGDVLDRLRGVVFVAHNVKFDRDFLGAELASEGVFLPAPPSICTLQLSYRLHPSLVNHRLATCCEAAGVREAPFHCALEDARVTARLLVSYVREAGLAGMGVAGLLDGGKLAFPESWPTVPPSGRVVERTSRSRGRLDQPYLARIVASLPSIALDEESAPYIDLLDRALEDRRITEGEALALEHTATKWGLPRERVLAASQLRRGARDSCVVRRRHQSK
jgi:DNA polymerase-3 subunit epsilon